MKEKLSNRRILQIVSASVVCGLFVIGAILGVVLGICLSPNGDDILPGQKDNPFIFDVAEENCVQLSSTASTVADDGTVSQTLTASITPSSALQYFDWSISFANPNSAWANGKTVTDYVTLSNEDNSGTATVTCLQGFSEQIIVKAAAMVDSSCFATVTIDYANRITNIDVKVYKDGTYVGLASEKVTIDFDDIGHDYSFEGVETYDSLGTKKLAGYTITYGFTGAFNQGRVIAGSNYVKVNPNFGSHDITEHFNNAFPVLSSDTVTEIKSGWFLIVGNTAIVKRLLEQYKSKFATMANKSCLELTIRLDNGIQKRTFGYTLDYTASFSSLNVSNVTIDNSNITF